MYRVKFENGACNVCSSTYELEDVISEMVRDKVFPVEVIEVDEVGRTVGPLNWEIQIRVGV